MKLARGTKTAWVVWGALVAAYAVFALISWGRQGFPVALWVVILAIAFVASLLMGSIFALIGFWRFLAAGGLTVFWYACKRGASALWCSLAGPRRLRPWLLRYCTRCGAVEERMFYARGSWLVCILLCCLFLVPGIIYFVWMRSTEHYGCQKCGSMDIVPLDSPVARRALDVQGAQV